MNRSFHRLAIVNRGEAAMRFIHAAREFNYEHGTTVRTIALFTDPEIIELGMVTGQFIGFGRLIAALDLENPRQPEG